MLPSRGANDSTVNAMLFKNLRDDIEATRALDPAARSRLEVVFCYPGFQALLFYRMGNWLWRQRCYFLGRFVSHETDADHASSEQYFSDDGGHTWELNWINHYTRVKG